MLAPIALVELPAAAFPPGHKVFTFNFNVASKSRIAKMKQTISPPMGTFKGGLDTVTGQLNGGLKLPNVTFAAPTAGLGSVTAALTQVKPVAGKLDLKTNKITATTTFLIKIISAYAGGGSAASAAALPHVTLPTLPVTLPSLPVTLPSITLPPITLPVITLPGSPPPGTSPAVNLVGKSCVTSQAITMVLKGTAKPTAGSQLLGSFTIPKFKSCGSLTGVLNRLLPGPGNTFAATATPVTSSTSLPITLPSLPVTLPSLPITLPSLPVTLPSPPTTLPHITLPTIPVTLPTLPHVTLPTLPVTIPTLPHG